MTEDDKNRVIAALTKHKSVPEWQKRDGVLTLHCEGCGRITAVTDLNLVNATYRCSECSTHGLSTFWRNPNTPSCNTIMPIVLQTESL